MTTLFILLVVMQFKHLIADYFLQNEYMLGKFKYTNWEIPLAAHCAVHFVFTFIISYCVLQYISLSGILGCIDFIIHFVMDRIKASPDLLGQFKSLTKEEYLKYHHMANNSVLYNADRTKQRTFSIREQEYAKDKIKSNKYFWWSLGLDQTIHHLTDILIVFMIVNWST